MKRRLAITVLTLAGLAVACGSSVPLGSEGGAEASRSLSWPLALTYEVHVPAEGQRQVVRFSGASWRQWTAEHQAPAANLGARCQVVLDDQRWSSNPMIENPDGCDDVVPYDRPVTDQEVYPDGWFIPITPYGAQEHPLANQTSDAQAVTEAEVTKLASDLGLAVESLTGQFRGCISDCAPDDRSRLVVELRDARVPLANIEYVGGERVAWMQVVEIERLGSWQPPAATREG